MSTVIYHVKDSVLPLELRSGDTATTVSEIVLFLTTSATAGNRTLQLELRASTPKLISVANWMKAAVLILVNKLNADTGVADVDYAGCSAAAATSLSTAYTLLNDVKAKLNAIHTKLDADAGVALTVYAAQVAIGSANATTPATAITLANEILVDLRRLCNLLDGETTVADENYESLVMAGASTALTACATKNASAVTAASQTKVRHTFSVNVTDGSGSGYVNTQLSAPYTIPAGACLAVNIATPVDAANDVFDCTVTLVD